jgi:hypothetical protein
MNNKSMFGFYIGFSLFAIQTITGELYRDYKMKQHNNKMKSLLNITTATTATTKNRTKD